jgi:GT2 family glycosyltransferase/spore maturation protein CgeB
MVMENIKMSLLKQGDEALRNKDYRKAVKIYKKVISERPELALLVELNLRHAESMIGNQAVYVFYAFKIIEKCKNTVISLFYHLFLKKKNVNRCVLIVDSVTCNLMQGWAMNVGAKDSVVVLQVSVDDVACSLVETSLLRQDVKNIYGGDGFYGYRAELSPYLNFSPHAMVQIAPVSNGLDQQSYPVVERHFPSILKGVHFSLVNDRAAVIVESLIDEPKINDGDVKTSIIILNLNGEKVIGQCIGSILDWNDTCEVIVVDHASVDDSIKIIENFASSRIKVIKRDRNYSYSDSNNLGAKEASGEVLVFLNNDIVLTSDSVSTLSKVVTQTMFGLMGIRLWDLPVGENFVLDDGLRVTQHLGVHFNGLNRKETIEAFELRSPSFVELGHGILETPAVTAAMLAIKKDEFERLGGFNEQYFYGQEDVDFCLRYLRDVGRKAGVLLDEGAYHMRGLSRKALSQNNKSYMADNRKVLQSELGSWFRKAFNEGLFSRPGFWNQKPFSVAMIVSGVSFDSDKADFFTAKELGDAFEENANTVVGYFDGTSDYDVVGYDLVIVYIDGFDPRRLKNLSPHTVLVGWARNWFDRWCGRVWIESYDFLYASSEKARIYMEKTLKRKVSLLRIAASSACVKAQNLENNRFESDYVFTGSYFNSPREIADLLDPTTISFRFKLFGHNWENHPKFKNFTNGPVSYKDIPAVYANTKIVVDDANIATKKWGSINCRVFDALSMGIPCITNNTIGVEEIFDEPFPVYAGDEVNELIGALLSDYKHTKAVADKFKAIILKEHTYQNRRDQILNDMSQLVCQPSIAIKIAAPDFESAVTWGDYHFARSLRLELERFGNKVRIDCLDQWYGSRALNDDVNLILRGLSRFKGRDDQVNLMWLISHPDMVSEEELQACDHVFVASEYYAKKLKAFTGMKNITFLPQASAYSVDELDEDVLKDIPEHEILFVGHSRNEYRETVRWCVEEGLPISVYGSGWERFIPSDYIKGQFIDNDLLPYYYHKAGVVLSDHWQDMRKKGFVSNRIYDVLSVNGRVLTDSVVGVELLIEGMAYKDRDDFLTKLSSLHAGVPSNPSEPRDLNAYSFFSRANTIQQYLYTNKQCVGSVQDVVKKI